MISLYRKGRFLIPAFFSLAHLAVWRRRQYARRMDEALSHANLVGSEKPVGAERWRLEEYVLLGMALGETLSLPRGGRLTEIESRNLVRLSLFAPWFDDWFDGDHPDLERMQDLIDEPSRFNPENGRERLLHQAMVGMHATVPDRDRFLMAFRKVFLSQKESVRQAGHDASLSFLSDVTVSKGGWSALLYRSLLTHEWREGEAEATFRMGALVQLMDDVFDVYKDLREGVNTLATECQDMRVLRDEFRRELLQTFREFHQLDFPLPGLAALTARLVWVMNRGDVCFWQWETLQTRSGGIFRPHQYSEKELLCDMETPGNFWRSLKFAWQFPWVKTFPESRKQMGVSSVSKGAPLGSSGPYADFRSAWAAASSAESLESLSDSRSKGAAGSTDSTR
jgi:hypothetical protein